ncbi:MAG: response regulator [Holosporales bacterium]|jgi:CheY-like chemotaxis protein|nr:response regulator [Holosporales bacterium]
MNTDMEKELTTIDEYIGRRLLEKRIRRGYTLACVASYIGRSYQQVHKYEKAESRIPASVLYRLANFYGIGVDKFFEGIGKGRAANGLTKEEKINILLVEDDPGDEAITREALSAFHNLNILCVHDGVQTMEVLKYKTLCPDFPRPALIFLDLSMPRKNGITTLKEIKRDLEIQDIPVVVLTNSVNNDVMSSAYKNGAAGYICKSFDFSAFKKNMEDCVNYWSKAVALPSMT